MTLGLATSRMGGEHVEKTGIPRVIAPEEAPGLDPLQPISVNTGRSLTTC